MESAQSDNIGSALLGILQKHRAAANVAQAVLQQTINAVYEQLGLSPNDQISLETGKIIRAAGDVTDNENVPK